MWNPFKKPPTELDNARTRYENLHAEREALELARELQYEASRIEYLKSIGSPDYKPERSEQQGRTELVPIPVYETDPITKYPYVPKLHFEQVRHEQDPLFGWYANPFEDWYNLSSSVPTGAFPRELFPQFAQTLRTQIAFDASRFMSRVWFETVPTYSGLVSHLRNYVFGAGLTIEVTSEEDAALAAEVNEYIDEFATFEHNDLQKRVYDAVLGLYRDGESFLRLYPGAEYPTLRNIDPSWIRGPHNEIFGKWALGILTSWPEDYDDAMAYHLWLPDNNHYDVAPTQMFQAKLPSVGPNTKRGIPLAWRMRKQLSQLAKLTDCIAIGAASRAAIPYLQQFAIADKAQIQGLIAARRHATWNRNLDSQIGPYRGRGEEIQPGDVRYINQGQTYVPPPRGYEQESVIAYEMLCEVIAQSANVPLWLVTATAKQETYSNALVSESPLVKNIEVIQGIICEHFKKMLESCVSMAIAKGRFPMDTLDKVCLCLALPSPISRDTPSEIEAYMSLVNKGVLSPQALDAKFDIDFTEQRELIKVAEADGWVNSPEREVLQARPTGEETATTAAHEQRREQEAAPIS